MRLTVLGIVIAVVGGVALYFGGLPYTEREQILDIGPIQATAEVRDRVDVPPLVGGAILAFGVGLAVYGAVRRR